MSNYQTTLKEVADNMAIPEFKEVLQDLFLQNSTYLAEQGAHSLNSYEANLSSKQLAELLNKKEKLCEFALDVIIDSCPKPIRKAAENFDSYNGKLMVLLCALVCAGAIMNDDVTGIYHNQKTFASLFLAIVAAAASNKSAVNYSKILLKKIHKHFREKSEQALAEYQMLVRAQKQQIRAGGGSSTPLKQPPYQVVVVSGDITSAKLLQQLYHNAGIPCILIEDEMDAVVLSGSGEHGKQINRILRNIYHHAPISQQRKGDNQHYEVDQPIMSLILAGTPDQFKNLLGSYENGLASRFTVLAFEDGPTWLSPAPCEDCPNREEVFERLSEEYFQMWQFFRRQKLEVKLTSEQWQVINEFGQRELSLVYNFQHETLAAVVKRTSLQIFRLAMVLTALRVWENKEVTNVATCTDEDFEIAFKLIQHAYLCGLEFFQSFKGERSVSAVASAKDRLFQSLPESFSRAEMLEHAKALRIATRSADGYIKDFVVGGMMEKVGHGRFQKTSLAKHVTKRDEESEKDH